MNEKLKELLGRVFDGAREGLRQGTNHEEYARRRHDFILHMTDWRLDLDELTSLFEDPDAQNEAQASAAIIGFLYHVIPHLNAAGRLLLDEIPDAFCMGGRGQGEGVQV